MRATVSYGAGDVRVETVPDLDFGTSLRNITLTGGLAPARAYIGELLPDVLDGHLQPGRYSTPPSIWTGCPTGTGRWPTARC